MATCIACRGRCRRSVVVAQLVMYRCRENESEVQ